MYSGLGNNTPTLDAFVDGKLPNDLDSESILSKVIGQKLADGSSWDLYFCCRINFENDYSQIQASQFMNLGILAINTLNEGGLLGTTATRVLSPEDGSNWSALNHVFGEATAVRMSATKSDHDYN